MLRLILVLTVRLRFLHGLDGLLETILSLLEVFLGLVTLLFQEFELTFPKGLVLVVSVLPVLVLALILLVLHAETLKLSVFDNAITLALDLKILNTDV
jgi:hypothetical protein